MSDRQLIADLLSALEYHTEPTRPIEFSKVAIEAAREHLRKPAQRKPLTDEEIVRILRPDVWAHVEGATRKRMLADARAIERAHGIKENT